MTISVFMRGAAKEEEEFLGKIMSAAKIEDWKIVDTNIVNPKATYLDVGIAMGQICGRHVKSNVKKLFILPTVKQLKPTNENRVHRQKAWTKLQEIKDFLDGKGQNEIGDSWQYATVCLPGQKKIIIYETAKPPNVEADIFISRTDSNLLLKMKEAFRAEAVVIGEEDA
jgi:hypothetical protein